MTTQTREAIMDAAKLVVQREGYNALSFRELAKDIGIKNASVHYHFPTKGDLGQALAKRYTEEAKSFLEELSLKTEDGPRTMRAYVEAFRTALKNDNRMCLCGIMLAERDALPEAVLTEVERFRTVNVDWLREFISVHRPAAPDAEVEDDAVAIFSAIEGAQLVSRGSASIDMFNRTMERYGSAGLFPVW